MTGNASINSIDGNQSHIHWKLHWKHHLRNLKSINWEKTDDCFFFFGKMKPVHVPTSFDGCGRGFCLLHLYLRELIGDGRLVVPDADVGAQSVLVDVDVVVVIVVGQLQRRELGLERRIVAAAAGRRHRR